MRTSTLLAYLIVMALYAVLFWMLHDWYLHTYCSVGPVGTWECRK